MEFGERDAAVLQLIEEEELKGFSFDGLKRTLGVHSETLSRVLGRLEGQGVVQKTSEGYRVTPRGEKLLQVHPLTGGSPSISLLRTLVPSEVPLSQITSELRGRWFGGLRWLGYSLDDLGVTLKWVTEEGEIRIYAVFSDGELRIEARLRDGKDLGEAVRAAHQLMGHIARYYSRPTYLRHVAYLPIFHPYLRPASM